VPASGCQIRVIPDRRNETQVTAIADKSLGAGNVNLATKGNRAMSKEEAIRRLTARWNEQVEQRVPSMVRTESALALYICCNIDTVCRNNLLEDYAK
jgi:hypothetical protein